VQFACGGLRVRDALNGQLCNAVLILANVALTCFATSSAVATDAAKFDSNSSQDSWAGFYTGVTAGAAWGEYNPRTSTVVDGYLGPVGTSAVNSAGAQTIRSTGFVAGLEGGYNWQIGNLLLGMEADLQASDVSGTTDSGAIRYPRGHFAVTSYANTDWLLTARPRIGFVAPNHWLFYATGGLALTQLQGAFSFIDNNGALESGGLNALKAGYAVGGGVEAPLTRRLSFKVDYLFVDFANTTGAVTANTLTPFFPGQTFTHSNDFKADVVRAGLNYHFGDPDLSSRTDLTMPFKAPVWVAKSPLFSGWEVEAGVRSWLSSGSVGAPQPLIDTPPTVLASRLTYSGLDAVSGEVFARLDHASGFFIKGFLGAGGITNGRLNDEDFPAGPTYSNTFSSASGHLGYAAIDVGYNVLRVNGGRVGPFIGYSYYAQGINTYGCTQTAGSTGCSPALPTGLLGLTENDSFNSLRVGLSSELMLTDRLRLSADAAYVPWVTFSGLDDHLLRQLLLPESSNSGNGVMLEATLDYYITSAWSVGIGGRYWAWNMSAGTVDFAYLALPTSTIETGRYTTERYGVFVQSTYHWGEPPPTAGGAAMLTKGPIVATRPMDWTGLYVGAHFGGGWSNGSWSDPFGSTPGPAGFVNVAGFGDNTHATGPLGGGQIGFDWQLGHLVLGAEVAVSAANMRGENTCFSGIGGIDCQHTVSSLGTVTGRVGYAWNRSLAYVKGGGAWTDTNYSLFGDTDALTLGSGSTTIGIWGWTVGGGIEYALTNHWTALVEYDHIGLPSTNVPFPTVALISSQSISVRQTVDLFKLGLNYKVELAALGSLIAKE
jgi:opacity protein-like surface antigen